MNKKRYILKMVFNCLAGAFALGGAAWYYIRQLFFVHDVPIETLNLYFTVNSNIFLGYSCVIAMVFYLLQFLKGKEVPLWVTVLKYMATVSVGITFFTVVLFLTPMFWADAYNLLYRNSNLLMHVLSPICAMIGFLLFEIDNPLKFRATIFPMLPMLTYTVVYMTLVLSTKNTMYDLYGFVHSFDGDSIHYDRAVISIIAMPIASYGLSVLIWYLNKLRYKKAK